MTFAINLHMDSALYFGPSFLSINPTRSRKKKLHMCTHMHVAYGSKIGEKLKAINPNRTMKNDYWI